MSFEPLIFDSSEQPQGKPSISRRRFHGQLAGAAIGSLAAAELAADRPTTQAAEKPPAEQADDPIPIWDLHCHLSGVSGDTPQKRIAKLMEFADRMGVARLVFFMGFPWSLDPQPDDFRRQNDQVLEALKGWEDRAFGFAYLNPKHVAESLAELERCVAKGPMVGVKLWVAHRCKEKELDPIIRRAGELGAVIFQHTWFKVGGNHDGESTPSDLAKLAARHPKTEIICGHTGGDWERGIRAIRGLPNVSIGTGGFDPTAGMMEMALRELGPKRIIYGSDIGGRSFASQLAKVVGADIPDSAKRLILGGNLKRMLAPLLKAKGIQT